MGLDPALVRNLDREAEERYPKLYSVLVVKDGVLVAERYYRGAGPETLMDIRSVTKSFTGTAIGIALKEGIFCSLEDPLEEYVPEERFPSDNTVRGLTLRELLTMSSGLYWKTGNKLGEAFIQRFHRSKDWLKFILRLPVDPQRRGRFLYRSPDSHLLSCLITWAAGRNTSNYLKDRLFGPLGIRHWEWEEDPQGNTAGHISLKLRSRDMAKLGLLYLNGGLWNRNRILDEEWVSGALQPQVEGMPGFGGYGYHWWSSDIGGVKASYALGHGGNFIIVLPELGCVMVTASEPKVSRWRDPRKLAESVLLPACLRR